jgi:hypothetical protein
MPRANRQTLDERELRFVKGVVEGKSLIRAAKDAGYAKSTAEKKSHTFLQRPLVRSALTNALERIGVTLEAIVQPISDALKATKSYVTKDGLMVESQVPDHKIRLEAARDGVALLGGIPKVGEGTPTAHGLNLFIAVDHGQERSEQMPPRVMKDITPSPTVLGSSVPRAPRRDP